MSEEIEELKTMSVAETLSNMRLDVGLVKAGLSETRSQGQKLIDNKKVLINGKPEKASYKLQIGDSIEVSVPAPKSIDLVPYDFPIEVIFEDDSVIVVNKPAGLVVHPAYGHENDTLINALLFRKTQLSNSQDAFRPGLVHRIDKGTSGLLVLAKNESAHNHLAKQFLKKTIHRKYWAMTFSRPRQAEGTISSHLMRDPRNRQRFQSTDNPEGKLAISHYKTLLSNPSFSLLEMKLETGRTHQIRVHLSSLNLPIVGDDVYNGKKQAKNLKNQELKKLILNMDRFCLHAKELGFNHPETHENLMFTSKIPEDLAQVFELGGFSDFLE